MKKHSTLHSGFLNLRSIFASALVLTGVTLAVWSFAADPPSGSILPTTTTAPQWIGTATGTGAVNGEAAPCTEGLNCDTYTLTIGPGDWSGKRVQVRIQQASSDDDTDLVIHKGDNSGPIIATSGNGTGVTEVGFINPNTDGTGVYTVHVIYFATVPGEQYHGNAEVVPLVPTPPPAATVDTTNKIGYENFEVPGAITPVTTANGPTVEWLGRNAGEPSIGVNWQSPSSANGVTNMQSDLETLFVNFSDTPANGGGATATWANRPAPTQVVIDSDPIGFTDVITGRAFAAELSATSPGCKVSYTESDGTPTPTFATGWSPTSGPLGSGIDHETIGGGHYNESALPPPVHPLYPNAIYYCSQDLVTAFCLRSDDGGQTFPNTNQSDTYTTECGGLHGHVKVSPAADGTVYLPNKDCTGNEAAVVSENNGVTWSIRPVSNATVQPGPSSSDPAVAVDKNGRAYFAMAADDSSAVVAFSDDHGTTWQNIVNVSTALGLKNIRYPAAVAGDANRAAVAFLGSTTAGDANSATFNGVWHLYVSHTFDGGLTWTTTDATPNMPVQRGNIWTGGGANIGRNMLDFFDIAIDKLGRVQVGYVNGCAGGNCAQAAATATGNAYSATASILRQSSGKRMLAASDGIAAGATAPGMPFVTQRRVGGVVHLSWSEGDPGSSSVTGYRVLRGTSSGAESTVPIASLPGTKTQYDDLTATDPDKTYFYKVVALNSVGSSVPNNEVAAPFVGDTCGGIIIHRNDPTHPESATANANPQLAIDFVAVGEPAGGNNLMFKMKVTNLSTIPPNSRWRMVWDSFASPGQQYYVGMRSDASSNVTFDYGTIATAVVGLVVGVPTETPIAAALPASNFQPDGTITVFVPKDGPNGVGNPQPGDLLGAVNGRTFTGDTPETANLERSTTLVDHTFVKAQTDNAFPVATYTVAGNSACAIPTPVSVVSLKTHGTTSRGVPLPLVGPPGIECRVGTPSGKDFHVRVTFAVPVTVSGVTVSSSDNLATATESVSGKVVNVQLHKVSNAQTIAITLLNVTEVSDTTHTGDVSVPMGILLGDVNSSGRVDSGDVSIVRQDNLKAVNSGNFRADVDHSGRIDSGDVTIVRKQNLTALP